MPINRGLTPFQFMRISTSKPINTYMPKPQQTLWVKPPQSILRRVISDIVRMETATDAVIAGASLFLFTFGFVIPIIEALVK